MKTVATTFFSSWRFPTFSIGAAIGYVSILLALLLLPSDSDFAEEFRTSCFGFDPETGLVAWIVVFSTFTVPLLVALVVAISWWRELHAALRTLPAVPMYFLAGFSAALAISFTLMAVGDSRDSGEMPFPAEALRSQRRTPQFELEDHTGRSIRRADLDGRVVLVTAIFSRCGYSCPKILSELQNAVAALTPEQLDELRIVVITLDPENDTRDVMAQVAAARGFASPPFHLLTGQPERVEGVLDNFGFPRSRNAETGFIDHADLYLLIDREGRIAYRFTLGERQQTWLVSALVQLLAEQPSTN